MKLDSDQCEREVKSNINDTICEKTTNLFASGITVNNLHYPKYFLAVLGILWGNIWCVIPCLWHYLPYYSSIIQQEATYPKNYSNQ